jgi:hypothetical protein
MSRPDRSTITLSTCSGLDHDVHLGAERRPAAVGCKSIAIANDV